MEREIPESAINLIINEVKNHPHRTPESILISIFGPQFFLWDKLIISMYERFTREQLHLFNNTSENVAKSAKYTTNEILFDEWGRPINVSETKRDNKRVW